MAIDMNADIGEILKGLFSRNASAGKTSKDQSPYTRLILAGVGVFVVVSVYVVFVHLPKQEELNVKSEQVNQIGRLGEEINQLGAEILSAGEALAKNEAAYDDMSKRFLSGGEIDKLYRYISRLALTHKIMIAKLQKTADKPVFQAEEQLPEMGVDDGLDAGLEGDPEMPPPPPPEEMMDEGSNEAPKPVAYYRLLIQLNASSNFLGWASFRRDLAKMEKIIRIENENIKLVKSEKEKGRVQVTITFAAFRWPANDDEKFAVPGQEEEREFYGT